MLKKSLILTSLLLASLNATASNLLELAHKAGFNRCDSAITTEFQDLNNKDSGIASTGYFNDRSFNIMASWGEKSNSVWKNTTFIKFGRSCLAYSVVGTHYPKDCTEFKEKNAGWELIKQQGLFTWLRNKGGVNAILKPQANGSCEITYRIHQNYESGSTAEPQKKAANKSSKKGS